MNTGVSPTPARSGASKVARFLAVGVANTVIDLIVFAALLALGASPLIANGLAWSVAVIFSYLANSRWSFERDRGLSETRSALRFVSLGALISLGVSSAVIAGLAGFIGVWPAKILGIVIAAILNFIAARWSIENKLR